MGSIGGKLGILHTALILVWEVFFAADRGVLGFDIRPTTAVRIGGGKFDIVVDGFEGGLVVVVEIPVLCHDCLTVWVRAYVESVSGAVAVVIFPVWIREEIRELLGLSQGWH